MLKREVKSSDYEEVGKLLNVEPEALLAVIETELTGRSGLRFYIIIFIGRAIINTSKFSPISISKSR